LKILYFL